jgi:hypothetical protein
VSLAAITLCVASQQVFVVVYFIASVRKLLDMPSFIKTIRKMAVNDEYANQNNVLFKLALQGKKLIVISVDGKTVLIRSD